jgi:RNA polymerase sigma-70 factor (ECF subfamily)
LSEQELIGLLRKGDQNAFKMLVESQQDRVFNTVLGMIQDVSEAEDLAQEVFIQVFRSIDGFKGESKLSTWIYRIAITKSLDWIRKKKVNSRFQQIRTAIGLGEKETVPIDFVHPGIQLEQKESAASLFRAIAILPTNQRVAINLIKVEGLNYEEVSVIMNISVKAVESLMHRAKENLRKTLKNEFQIKD